MTLIYFVERGESNNIPNINKILIILEPNTLAMAKLDKPFTEAILDTAHSGAEVPMPNKITPTKKGFILNFSANTVDFLINKSAPTIKATRPKNNINK